MKQNYLLVVLIFGCVFAQTFADEVEEAKPAEGGGGGEPVPVEGHAQALNEFKGGWADAIRADPEHSAPYFHGNVNFEGLQAIMDNYFNLKKQEGDRIQAVGKATRENLEQRQIQMQNKQYDIMFKGFKAGEADIALALQPLSDNDGKNGNGGHAGSGAGFDEGSGPGGEGAAPPPAGGAPEGGEAHTPGPEVDGVTMGSDASDPEAE